MKHTCRRRGTAEFNYAAAVETVPKVDSYHIAAWAVALGLAEHRHLVHAAFTNAPLQIRRTRMNQGEQGSVDSKSRSSTGRVLVPAKLGIDIAPWSIDVWFGTALRFQLGCACVSSQEFLDMVMDISSFWLLQHQSPADTCSLEARRSGIISVPVLRHQRQMQRSVPPRGPCRLA